MQLRIGIVGVGNVVMQNYLPFLATRKDVELAYYNRTAEKAKAAAAKFGGQAFGSIAELIAWKPDSVLVLTSETCRHQVGMQLIEAGAKRLFFEKPLVAAKGQAHVSEQDFADARQMLHAAKDRGIETAMIFNYRFFDQSLAAKRIVEKRGFGKVIHVMGMVHYACWSHCIDLVHDFAGPLEELTALDGSVIREGAGIKAADVTAAFRTVSGTTGTLIGTCGLQWHHPLFELLLTFERGRIHLRDLDGDMEILDAQTRTHERVSIVRDTSRWNHYSTSFAKSVGAYLDSLQNKQAPPVPGVTGLYELQVEAALRRSAAQKRPVRVQEEFPV